MPLYILHLDAYHLGDPLFLQQLAGLMGRAQRPLPPTLIVHGSGEQAERLLEARGLFPERRDGRLVIQSQEEAILVERAIRDLNRTIVNRLTDEGVHAVGFQGSDRGLLKPEEGEIGVGKVAWVGALIASGVLPVLSTLVYDEEARCHREASEGDVLLALARAFDRETVVMVAFFRQTPPDAQRERGVHGFLSPSDLGEGVLAAPEVIHRLVETGLPVLLTSPRRFYTGVDPEGTYLKA